MSSDSITTQQLHCFVPYYSLHVTFASSLFLNVPLSNFFLDIISSCHSLMTDQVVHPYTNISMKESHQVQVRQRLKERAVFSFRAQREKYKLSCEKRQFKLHWGVTVYWTQHARSVSKD
jgi:hypothetical protein